MFLHCFKTKISKWNVSQFFFMFLCFISKAVQTELRRPADLCDSYCRQLLLFNCQEVITSGKFTLSPHIHPHRAGRSTNQYRNTIHDLSPGKHWLAIFWQWSWLKPKLLSTRTHPLVTLSESRLIAAWMIVCVCDWGRSGHKVGRVVTPYC